MADSHYIAVSKRLLAAVGLALIAGLVLGLSLAAAQGLVQPDGRINQVHHFGGDAFYCVDRNFNPTHQYSDFGEGGFRLLNLHGQELWFVPATLVAEQMADVTAGGGVLIASGPGTYGTFYLWGFRDEAGDDFFQLTGVDEYGKPNTMEFKFCIPVGPVPGPPGDDGLTCVIRIGSETPVSSELTANSQLILYYGSCDDCQQGFHFDEVFGNICNEVQIPNG